MTRLFAKLKLFSTIGAWLFAIGSFGALVLVIILNQRYPESAIRLLGTDAGGAGGAEHAAVGLHYAGTFGAIQAWTQAAIVGAAIIASVLPWPRIRALGHTTLLVWSVLWLGNAIWIARLEPGLFHLSTLLVIVFSIFFLATVARFVGSLKARRKVIEEEGVTVEDA